MKNFIVTYRSDEHYEVLGWVMAHNLEEAKEKAKEVLKGEINKYGVVDAMIAEWGNSDNIHF